MTVAERPAAALGLAYRHSALADTDLVVTATFQTLARPRPEGEAIMREIIRWRRQNQPGGTLNAGSVFKNPPGDAAGRLIDQAGLKGLRVGGVAVSEKHANFFVADAGASAQDLYDLVRLVRRRVRERDRGAAWSPRCASSACSKSGHDGRGSPRAPAGPGRPGPASTGAGPWG